MQESDKDKFEALENRYRNLQNQEQESLNLFKSTVRSALDIVDPKSYARAWRETLPFFDSALYFKSKVDLFMKLKEQIEYANMQGQLADYPNKPLMITNFFYLSGLGWGLYRIKSWSVKFTFFVDSDYEGLTLFKTIALDAYFGEAHLRKVALEQNSPVAQEVRNLFFAPQDPDAEYMTQKCKEYLDILEMRRTIKKNRQDL